MTDRTSDVRPGQHVEQDQVEVHWQHPRHELENPALLVWPNPTKEEWAAEIVEPGVAVVVCRMVLWKDSDDEVQKYAEQVDPLDEIPGYVNEALLDYDSNYGPIEHVVNPVNREDEAPPEEPIMTFDDYFVEADTDA